MIWNFGNCMIPKGSGINLMYETCCCSVSCSIQNISGATQVVSFLNVFANSTFSVKDILIDSGPPVFPLFISDGDSIALSFTICASQIGDTDSIEIDINSTFGAESQKFDFEAIDLSTSVNVSSLDFGNVTIGSSVGAPITIFNPTLCCYIYGFESDCAEVTTTTNETGNLCQYNGQTIGMTLTPTTLGNMLCHITLTNECGSFSIPIAANGVQPEPPGPTGENPVSGKRTVVDCPTSDCRLANGQPGFAQSTKNSINQISRATSPKGGAGRGTNFRK